MYTIYVQVDVQKRKFDGEAVRFVNIERSRIL